MGRVLCMSMALCAWFAKLTIWPVTRLISCFKRARHLPPINDPILHQSAGQLAMDIRTQKVSCERVIKAYIERISTVNVHLNCIVDERFSEALEEAKRIDEMIKEKPEPDYWAKHKPLLGVPVTVKGSIAVSGLCHHSGSKRLAGRRAEEDAESVKHLKSKGALVVGISATPELCLSYECFNKVNGVTNNPYDTRRTPGGSSGGEGALLGAGASVIGVGSDVAGSCRLPALFCGVYGHKPTPGVVSSHGHIPFSKDRDFERYFTIAPMCRYAQDLPLLLKCLITDSNKEACLNLEKPVDFKKLKIYYAEDDGQVTSFKMHKEIKSSMRKVLKHFETKYFVQPVKLDTAELNKLFNAVTVVIGGMKDMYGPFSKSFEQPGDTSGVFKEFMKFFICNSENTLPALIYGPVKKYADSRSEKKIAQYLQYKRDLMNKIKDLLQDNGVFLFPTFYDLANFHYQFYYKVLNVNYLTLFNLLEMPVTACPLGLAKDGRPLGIQIAANQYQLQIAANQYQDRMTFAVAQELQEAFGGWVPPTPSDIQTV